jgi:hypothetical protein
MPEEAKYSVSLSKPEAMLYSSSLAGKAESIKEEFKTLQTELPSSFTFIEISAALRANVQCQQLSKRLQQLAGCARRFSPQEPQNVQKE